MWGACVYPEQYLLLWYILTPLLLHTKRTIQALYEVSIPYDPNAPLAGALFSSPDSHITAPRLLAELQPLQLLLQ